MGDLGDVLVNLFKLELCWLKRRMGEFMVKKVNIGIRILVRLCEVKDFIVYLVYIYLYGIKYESRSIS